MRLKSVKMFILFPFRVITNFFRAVINKWPSDLFGVRLRYWYYKRKFFFCGKKVKILEGCNIFYPALIKIGDCSGISRYVELNPGPSNEPCLIIGDDSWIGPYSFFRTANHKFDNPDVLFIKQGHENKKIIIGNDVYVGAHCIFLGGTEVGDHSVIAAGSVVSTKIPPYSIVAGNPARVVRLRK